MKLGVLILLDTADVDSKFKQVADYGFHSCQLCCWDMSLYTDEVAENIKTAMEKYDVQISTLWAGWSGPQVWNPYDGPSTLGIVPKEYRAQRMNELMQGSDFAAKLGVDKVATHVGFIPENPATEEYKSLVNSIRFLANHYKNNGQYFLFETGQETPITLLRTIEEVAADNLGINLDPANLLSYGKGNPIDALGVFGKYVMDVHAKDGKYPTTGTKNGGEMPLGQGMVNFPEFIKKLKELRYDGTLTIEREITGEQQIKDIKEGKIFLEGLI
ncbi:MAG: sugar phosphate isomerase/epimerase [Clostridia bacterium]|nr:sugar phosphate isomerase/epimerase [Clostridia bacterium]